MFINQWILGLLITGLGVFFWWFFRKTINEGPESRRELLEAIKDLKSAIEKLASAQDDTNKNLANLQGQHDMVFKAGNMVKNHDFKG